MGITNTILTVAVMLSTLLTIVVLVRFGHRTVEGTIPLSPGAFVAVLFCSGLDVGLIMFPLTEYPVYEGEAAYKFAHPLAIELGMWGLLIWGFYFLTAFYFLKIEPTLRLFANPFINFVNSFVVMATCAFTGFIFLTSLPNYIPGMSSWMPFVIVGAVIALSCYSACDVVFMKWLSIGSMYGFFALGVVMFIYSGGDIGKYAVTLANYKDYFVSLPRFLVPFSDLHEFYLFWWFAWSIMIGQFMAKFASRMTVRKLGLLMIVIPSIPLSLWFAVLYIFHNDKINIPTWLNLAMVAVGIIFVVNSLDSLIRLYTDNLNVSVGRLGKPKFWLMNFVIMVALVAAYRFASFQIHHVGLVVIGLYAVTYGVMMVRHREVKVALSNNSVHAAVEEKTAT